MTAKIELKTASGGKVILDPQDTAVDATLVLPATSGTIQTSGATLTTSGNLTFTGTGNRITGDFSNATLANRVMFQTSTANGATQIAALPNGTNTSSNFSAHNASDPTNASRARIQVTSAEASFLSDITGTGTFLPMTFYTGGSERVRIDTSGNVGIGGTPSGSYKLQVNNGSVYVGVNSDATNGVVESNGPFFVRTNTANPLIFGTGAGGTERMRIDSSGNLLVGTTAYVAGGFGASSSGLNVNTTQPQMLLRHSGTGETAYLGIASNAVYFQTENAIPIRFGTNNAERARITAAGTFIIGATTGVAGRLSVVGSGTTSSTWATILYDSSLNQMFSQRDDGAIFLGAKAASPYNLTTGNAANANLGSDGFFYRSTSSIKYKTDVKDATFGLADVLKLRPVTYKGKTDGDKVFGGLIAEEVHDAGLTEFVQYATDGTPDALAYGNMVALAFKAIQELTAELNNVKAELAAMKGSA